MRVRVLQEGMSTVSSMRLKIALRLVLVTLRDVEGDIKDVTRRFYRPTPRLGFLGVADGREQ